MPDGGTLGEEKHWQASLLTTITTGSSDMISGSDTRNRWVLVDHLKDEQSALLSIGKVNYSGSSVRKNLDPTGRELLMDRMKSVAETGVETDEAVHYRAADYRVLTVPVTSPMTGMVLAVLSIYVRAGDEVPPRPPIGALEWKISFNGHIETSWNDDLFTIYELDRSGESPTGDMNQWVSQLISPEDRTRMKVTIDAAITSGNAQRYLVPYRIITRFGTDNPGFKNLEVSGRVVPDEQRQGKWLQAITREVQEITPSPITPGFGDFQSSSLLRAVFELASDQVLMAVDISCWQTFMTSATWERFGIQSPRYGYLPHIIYPDDYREFRDTVEAAVPGKSATIRMLHTDGKYVPYAVTASGGHDDHGDTDRYAVVRMVPVLAE